jgi:predicted small lipoprotein YifL
MIVRFMIASLLIVTFGLAACGKKGPLEPPKLSQSTMTAR